MRATAHHPASNVAPINFATVTKKPSRLPALLAAMDAAVAIVEKWAPSEDKLSSDYSRARPSPKVYGGRTNEVRIVREGLPDTVIPAADWFYRSRDEIEKAHADALTEATTDEARAEVDACFAGRLADWDKQAKACQRSVPKELSTAQRMLSKGHNAWSRAELDIINYQPVDVADAMALLEFAGKPSGKGVFFDVEADALKQIMRKAAAAMRKRVAQ